MMGPLPMATKAAREIKPLLPTVVRKIHIPGLFNARDPHKPVPYPNSVYCRIGPG